MRKTESDKFLSYYNNEMTYLRQSGKIFAKEHPKIAKHLEISDKESPDPHTERLLESFAFLTARLKQDIDNRFPEIATALLDILYPHLVNPMPAMTIAHFEADSSKGRLTTGYKISKGTPLFTYVNNETICRFQTTYPVTLWPIKVSNVSIIQGESVELKKIEQNPWYLKLELKVLGGLHLLDFDMDELIFHIHAEKSIAFTIYESLFTQDNIQIYASTKEEEDKISFHSLPLDSFEVMGYSENEMTLPIPQNSTHAYLLLQEFFHIPEKFLFFKIKNLKSLRQTLNLEHESFNLYIPVSDAHTLMKVHLHPSYFLLGCTPIVNLFKVTTDPLRLDYRKTKYKLIPDQARDNTTEIYSIEGVHGIVEGSGTVKTFSPFFSLLHHHEEDVFWYAKRISSYERNLPGSDFEISFTDLNFNPSLPPKYIVYADTLCTNRFLTEHLNPYTTLELEEAAPLSKIRCLYKPQPEVFSPLDGETLWKLISMLAVNHLQLIDSQKSMDIIKEILTLHAGDKNNSALTDINRLKEIKLKEIVRRTGQEAWRGFVKGVEITLTVKDEPFHGTSSFLLANVLRHFLALNVSMNSFVEVVLKSDYREGEWKRWQPLRGTKTLL